MNDTFDKLEFSMQNQRHSTAQSFMQSQDNHKKIMDSISREQATKECEERNHRKSMKELAIKQNKLLEESQQVQVLAKNSIKYYDVFVSHASDNKSKYVNKLRTELKKIGANVWYDVDCIAWGDSLSNTIDEGLKNCAFGIVVLSKEFFEKDWCQKELTALIERQKMEEEKVILPLLFDVSIDDVSSKYADLKDLLAIDSKKYSVKGVTILFAKELIKRLKSIIT